MLRFDDEDALAQLREALTRAGFTVERVESTLQQHGLSARPADIAVYARRLPGDDSFSTLARLFLLGVPVEREAAREALAPLPLERLIGLGLAVDDPDGRVRGSVRLVPHGELYLASDLHHESAPDTPSDYVAGIHAPSVTLAKLAVRRPVETTLDLGTGCGIQALLAAKHSAHVVATDVNRRALEFAAFNARLNGIANVEFRHGDTFAPVRGARFDLIVSNPPYVISPDSELAYRDSGLPDDTLCREIVRRTPRFLNEGGFAHVLVSWVRRAGEEPLGAPRAWVEGIGCDAWLLHYKTEDPVRHSASWLGPLGEVDVRRFDLALERWLEYLSALGADGIGYGAVVLRRRSRGRNWVHADELPLERLGPASEHTLRVFASQDYLRNIGDERSLLAEEFTLVDSHRLEQTLTCRDDRLFVESQTLALEEGAGFRVGLDRYTAALLPHFAAGRPLSDVLARAEATLPLADDERARFTDAALPVVRRLLELGFLVPAGGS